MNKNVWEITNKRSAAIAHEQNGAKYQLNSLVALEFSDDYTGEGFIFANVKMNLYDICLYSYFSKSDTYCASRLDEREARG